MLNNKKGQAQKRGLAYEEKKAKDHGRKHIGGPGKPDAPGLEVKDWIKPVSRPVIVTARKKGITKFISKSGFTKPAVDYGKSVRMKLYHGKKRLT